MNTNLNTVIPNDVLRGCNVIVRDCAGLKRYDTVTVISDYATRDIGKFITTVAGSITQNVVHHIIDPFSVHGQEPPDNVALQMCKSDVVFGVTKMSMAHTQARLKASQNGAKYLSLPDYSIDVLTNEALLIDFKSITPLSIYLAELLTEGDKITLWTEAGTDLECNIKDRIANPAPGWCYTKGSIASPPNAETNIALIENDSNGVLVVDGSVTCREIGLLQNPLTLTIENGSVVKVDGEKSDLLNNIFNSIGNPAARVVAEFGIGLNPQAKLCGKMLLDEGCLGTVHIGIGSNSTIGGNNKVPFHVDNVIRYSTVSINKETIMNDGRLIETLTKLIN